MEKALLKKLDIEFNSLAIETIIFPTRYDDFIEKLSETDQASVVNGYRHMDGCEPDPDKQWFNYHLRLLALRISYIRSQRVDPLLERVAA